MRVSKPIKLLIPKQAVKDLNRYLEKYYVGNNLKVEYFYYVIDCLLYKESTIDKEFFSLNMQKLQKVTVSNIGSYIKILKDGGLIISDNFYRLGKKAYHYKINPKYKGEHLEYELLPSDSLYKKLTKSINRSNAHNNRLEPFLRDMRSFALKVDMDYTKAKEWISNNVAEDLKLNYLSMISRIENQKLRFFKRNKTNKRLDTSFTTLKSELRQFIIGDYVSIDLKNAQPFLLGILIKNIINRDNNSLLCFYLRDKLMVKWFGIKTIKSILLIHHKAKKLEMVDLSTFIESATKGNFYEAFEESYRISRDVVKDILFKVLFSKNRDTSNNRSFIPYEKEKLTFAEKFPSTYEIICELKKKNNSDLPIYLQSFESFLFIDCIAKELHTRDIIPLTIHDSIIVKKEHQKEAMEVIENVFRLQIGVMPSFHITPLDEMK